MLWNAFQLAIFVGVVSTNIEWKWTPNGYLASLIGIGAAYVATVALSWLGLKLGPLLRKKRADHDLLRARQSLQFPRQ